MGDLPESCGVGSHHGACISAELRGEGLWRAGQLTRSLPEAHPGKRICLACFSNREAVVDWKMQQKKSVG